MTETEIGGQEIPANPVTSKDIAKMLSNNESNIIFVGKKIDSKTDKMVDAEPPTAIHTVGKSIKLPSASEQLKGFYHEDADLIRREMPDMYKEFKPKGAK